MHISGHVFTLSQNPELAQTARTTLETCGPFRLGQGSGNQQPAVLEVNGPEAAQQWHDWASEVPGVEFVEVVFVQWDHVDSESHHVAA
jgi:hypothetical protein